MTSSGVELGDASGHSVREPAPQAASLRRGRHARRETSDSRRADSPSAPILPTPRSADPADEPGMSHARRAAQIQRLPASVPAKSSLSYPSDVDSGPGAVTRRILPSELEQLADALVRRDNGDVVGYSRDAGQGESSGTPPGDLTRPYESLRLARHQHALEQAMPRDGDGRIVRLADPRVGQWFRLVDDGDSGRRPNSLDGVLALGETYLHGRPRVAASPISGGPADGVRRIERTIGSGFQNLCPFVGGADPAAAKAAVDAAMRNLANHLHNSGHGSFAFIVTGLTGGGCQAWAAVNQDGDILFLDPRMGRISEDAPLYGHKGSHADDNVVSMDALVVDGQGQPAPLPFHGRGLWSGTDG